MSTDNQYQGPLLQKAIENPTSLGLELARQEFRTNFALSGANSSDDALNEAFERVLRENGIDPKDYDLTDMAGYDSGNVRALRRSAEALAEDGSHLDHAA